jgi:hypothetical protein
MSRSTAASSPNARAPKTNHKSWQQLTVDHDKLHSRSPYASLLGLRANTASHIDLSNQTAGFYRGFPACALAVFKESGGAA